MAFQSLDLPAPPVPQKSEFKEFVMLGLEVDSEGNEFYTIQTDKHGLPSQKVKALLLSSVVCPPVQWVARSSNQARVRTFDTDSEEFTEKNEATKLLAKPNEWHSQKELFYHTVISLLLKGNAYWHVEMNGAGVPQALRPIDPTTVTPKSDKANNLLIAHYEYKAPGASSKVIWETDEVVHFRYGLNITDDRYGQSPIVNSLNEVGMDIEANEFSKTVLKNMGVFGIIITPEGERRWSDKTTKIMSHKIKVMAGGQNRGQSIVLGDKAKIEQFKLDLQGFDLATFRNIAEERVCAGIGIQPAVVGFGSGLQQTKIGATLRGQIELAWSDCIMNIHDMLASTLDSQYLNKFRTLDRENIAFKWDYTNVDIIQRQIQDQIKTWSEGWKSNLFKRSEVRAKVGLPVTDEDDVYYGDVYAKESPISMNFGGSRAGASAANDDNNNNDTGAIEDPDNPTDKGKGKRRRHTHPRRSHGNHPSRKDPEHFNITQDLTVNEYLFLSAIDEDFAENSQSFEVKLNQMRQTYGDKIYVAFQQDEIKNRVVEFLTSHLSVPKGLKVREAMALAKKLAKRYKVGGIEDLTQDELARASELTEDLVKWLVTKDIIVDPYDTLRKIYNGVVDDYYAHMHGVTVGHLENVFGLVIAKRDELAERVLTRLGKRKGLVYLEAEQKNELFKLLRNSRIEGHGFEQAARVIRETVGAGPWSDPAYRSKLIARTEIKYAQNISTLEACEEISEHVIASDNRLPNNENPDAGCIARDGQVFTLLQASREIAEEHPNGTLSFSPHFVDDDEEV